jgi:hypothetical protein
MKKYWMIILPIALSGCLLESIGRIDRNIKPYGAHWIKEGMTREGRVEDIAACGANRDLKIEFPKDSMDKTIALPVIQKVTGHQYATTEQERWSAANDLLKNSWRKCMVQRGYTQIPMGSCDARCLHP